MPTVTSTLATMRQGLQDYLGQPFRGTTSGAGNGGGTTFVDATNLINFQDDRFNYYWALLTSGANDGEVRRVNDFVKSTGTVTVESAYTAQVAGSVTYELMAHHPTLDLLWAINRALQETFSDFRSPYLDENLVTGNHLQDGGLEEWASSSALRFWSDSGSITLAQETGTKRYGTYSAKVTTGATNQTLHQNQGNVIRLLDLAGSSVNFVAWVHAADASHVRLQVYTIDKDFNTTTDSSDYHAGDSLWHFLRVTNSAIPADLRAVEFRLRCELNAKVAYFDHVRVTGPSTNALYLPRTGWSEISAIEIQRRRSRGSSEENLEPCDDFGANYLFDPVQYEITNDGTDSIARLGEQPAPKFRVRLLGSNYIPTVSADTDTAPLGTPELNLLYPWAAFRLFERLANGSEGSTREEYQRKGAAAKDDYNRMRGVLRLTKTKRQINFGNWRDSGHGRGRYRYPF